MSAEPLNLEFSDDYGRPVFLVFDNGPAGRPVMSVTGRGEMSHFALSEGQCLAVARWLAQRTIPPMWVVMRRRKGKAPTYYRRGRYTSQGVIHDSWGRTAKGATRFTLEDAQHFVLDSQDLEVVPVWDGFEAALASPSPPPTTA